MTLPVSGWSGINLGEQPDFLINFNSIARLDSAWTAWMFATCHESGHPLVTTPL